LTDTTPIKFVPLSVINHDRDSANLTYVYPVISRRAGGVSIGINLNPNNACNWRCVYCQVPDLTRGTAPPVNLNLLAQELQGFLHEILHGDFMQSRVPHGMRRINDIALSGNGEPTSSTEFAAVIELIAELRAAVSLPDEVKTVLITNGSLMHREVVQNGLRGMAKINGVVWFKLDRASEAGMARVNDTHTTMDKVRAHLITAISLCPTWLQTCWFAVDGVPPSHQDEDDFFAFVAELLRDGHNPQGLLLYGLARPSMQAEAPRLSALPKEKLEQFADKIRALGLKVKVSD
jgi:wyosine [tRNA(Phe)-imidazoG37] synthetase (radical SAM superfamily)